MTTSIRRRAVAAIVAAVFALAGCGSDGSDAAATRDGPTVTVASFTYNESVVLAEIYAQALEAAGYPVKRRHNLGSRELLYPEFTENGIDLLPEYLGSALAVGFGGTPTADVDETMALLAPEVASLHAQLLDAAPGQDGNVFVVTEDYARDHQLGSISDLSTIERIRFSGPAECETRTTCLLGLEERYDLRNLEFRVEEESAIRIASLRSGNVDLAVLFSTMPVFAEGGFVVLSDDEGVTAAENIVPVVSDETIEAYGAPFTDLINEVSRQITTDTLIALNARVEIDAQNPDDVAREFLVAHDLLPDASGS